MKSDADDTSFQSPNKEILEKIRNWAWDHVGDGYAHKTEKASL